MESNFFKKRGKETRNSWEESANCHERIVQGMSVFKQ